jgi:hypothetical protein
MGSIPDETSAPELRKREWASVYVSNEDIKFQFAFAGPRCLSRSRITKAVLNSSAWPLRKALRFIQSSTLGRERWRADTSDILTVWDAAAESEEATPLGFIFFDQFLYGEATAPFIIESITLELGLLWAVPTARRTGGEIGWHLAFHFLDFVENIHIPPQFLGPHGICLIVGMDPETLGGLRLGQAIHGGLEVLKDNRRTFPHRGGFPISKVIGDY